MDRIQAAEQAWDACARQTCLVCLVTEQCLMVLSPDISRLDMP